MKKLLALILAAALALSLVACGGDSGAGDTNTPSTGNGDTTSADTPSGSGEDSTPDETSEPQGLKVGDTTKTNSFEFTLTSVDFANELNTDTNNENFMLPLAEGENNSGNFHIKAPDGNILLTFTFTYNYIGKDGTNDPFYQLATPCISYGDGYTFDGSKNTEFVVIGRKDTEDAYWICLSHIYGLDVYKIAGLLMSGWEYKPLDKTIYEGRGYISVPLEVYENTDEPLSISFNRFDGDFIIR